MSIEKYFKKCPCIDCITYPICKATASSIETSPVFITKGIRDLYCKCTPLREYIVFGLHLERILMEEMAAEIFKIRLVK